MSYVHNSHAASVWAAHRARERQAARTRRRPDAAARRATGSAGGGTSGSRPLSDTTGPGAAPAPGSHAAED